MELKMINNQNKKNSNLFTLNLHLLKKKTKIMLTVIIVCFLIISSLLLSNINTSLIIFSNDFFWKTISKNNVQDIFFSNNDLLSKTQPPLQIIIESFHSKPKIIDSSNSIKNNNLKDIIATNFARNLSLKTKIFSNDIDREFFDQWIVEETDMSLQKLKENIADNNLNDNTLKYSSSGMIEGIVLASPSQKDPNYFYDWTRDTAITMNTIVNVLRSQVEKEKKITKFDPLEFSCVDVKLFGTVFKYMNRSFSTQRTQNPSGGFLNDDLKGLGEPKWEVNGHCFEGSWGRPQNDGPALRATTFMHFIKLLDDYNYSFDKIFDFLEPTLLNRTSMAFTDEKDFYDKVLYYDLKFIVQNWNKESFDVWEELNGYHFFTSMVQLNAMKLGIDLLESKKWDSPDGIANIDFIRQLNDAFNGLSYFIKYTAGFENSLTNYIIENPQFTYMRSGLDIATLIATVLTHDSISDDSESIVPYNYNNALVLNSLHELTKQMSVLYPINHSLKSPELGVSLGRYPEDVYNGNGVSEGNPWFLATATGAQLLYGYTNLHLKNKMDLVLYVSAGSWEQNFWSTIFAMPLNSNGLHTDYELVIPYGTPLYIQTLKRIMDHADSFLDQVRQHVADDGCMSEQFNKYTGYQQGAKDLTWSYGTFWNTATLRIKAQNEFNNINNDFFKKKHH